MEDEEHLFLKQDLNTALRSLNQNIAGYVDEIQERDFLSMDRGELSQVIYEKAKVALVSLDEAALTVETTETQVDVSGDPLRFFSADRTGPFYMDGIRVEWTIPFTGDSEVFFLRTNPFSMLLPRGRVTKNKLILSRSLPNDQSSDQFNPYFEEQMGLVRKFLGYANAQIEHHNAALAGHIEDAITAREMRIKKRKEVEAQVGGGDV